MLMLMGPVRPHPAAAQPHAGAGARGTAGCGSQTRSFLARQVLVCSTLGCCGQRNVLAVDTSTESFWCCVRRFCAGSPR